MRRGRERTRVNHQCLNYSRHADVLHFLLLLSAERRAGRDCHRRGNGIDRLEGGQTPVRVKPIDGWMMILTFLATLLLGSQNGMVIGVVFSLLVFIWRSAHPHAAELGYLEKEGISATSDDSRKPGPIPVS